MLSIGTEKSDRITTITNTTWAEYISLYLPKLRVSFRNGVITILSPGRNHELIGDYITIPSPNEEPNFGVKSRGLL